MLLPEHLREFIILHELCHTHHHNHAAAFHQLLNSLVGGRENELNRELKRHRIPRIEEI
jgi:predicted metal-dependent hydrolase